jgi:outer membrane protein
MVKEYLCFNCPRPALWLAAFALGSVCVASGEQLTLRAARDKALKTHPRISYAELRALAARQVEKQARAGFFPTLSGSVVAVGTANDNTRLAAIGGLNNPAIFERNAEGLTASQLITDFGRTANLSGSARFRADAEENNVQATREQIILEVDRAYFAALQAQAIERVAGQTVTNRDIFLEQVTALASNKMRSELDVSFAKVNLEDARLLLSKAVNDEQAALAQLSSLTGTRDIYPGSIAEHEPENEVAETNLALMLEAALTNRPELMRLRNEYTAAVKFARAERALSYPVISAVASAGVVPVHDPQLPDNYAAAGVGINIPLLTGGLYSARRREAALKAEAAQKAVQEEEENVVRDVKIAWLNTQNAAERLRITGQLLENARRTLELATARYENGANSIVELNQTQLEEITAEIAEARTRYEYTLSKSALQFQLGTLR